LKRGGPLAREKNRCRFVESRGKEEALEAGKHRPNWERGFPAPPVSYRERQKERGGDRAQKRQGQEKGGISRDLCYGRERAYIVLTGPMKRKGESG